MISSCPICSLMFRSGDEVQWHMHHEHHRLTEDEALKLEVRRAVSTQLDWQQFTRFAWAKVQPCVSVLVGTVPTGHAGHMAGIDRSWLDHLAANAHDRMAKVLHPEVLSVMSRRLDKVVAAAEHGPYDKGLALLVSPHDIGAFRLPLSPRPRVVVGERFAVRDLLDCLQHYPPYRVLVIGGPHVRLLEGWGGHLYEVASPTLLAPDTEISPDHWLLSERRQRALVTEADVILTERSSPGSERPLVVVGPPRLLAVWRQRTSCSSPIIGMVRSHHLEAAPQVIGRLTATVVASWREAFNAVEVACLEHAERNGLVKWGLAPAWHALSHRQVSDLWVTRTFVAPPSSPEGEIILHEEGASALPHCEDLVEELIRAAVTSGARAHFLDEGVIREGVGAQLSIDRRAGHLPSEHTLDGALT